VAQVSIPLIVQVLAAIGRDALMAALDEDEKRLLMYLWPAWARPEQLPPQQVFDVWLLLTGRGWGKTRTSAEWIRFRVEQKGARRIALVGRSAGDVREVMVEGPSGILAVCPPWNRPHYEPSKRRLTWPNGAVATTYSADEPDLLRGPEHDTGWADEYASWQYIDDAWDNLQFGLRLRTSTGEEPQVIVSTTPRPLKSLKALRDSPTTVVTKGSTFDNAANLAAAALRKFREKYEGTRVGRQELEGEILEDTPGALWTRVRLDACRLALGRDGTDKADTFRRRMADGLKLVRVVVGVDPAVSSGEDACDTGIVIAALGSDGHGYVLDDRSKHGSPDEWAREAVAALRDPRWPGDRIIGEVNNGGDLVEHTVRTVDKSVPYKPVRASRGKAKRAEPVAALYEQGKVHHVGAFPKLEDEMCTWTPEVTDWSPDRMDACVWALSELMVDPEPMPRVTAL
jgi:phage terminase large subunit-like protein